MPSILRLLLTTLTLVAITAATAAADTTRLLSDYAIFAGHQVTFTSSINPLSSPLGLVGSNGDISFAPAGGVNATRLEANGSMIGNPTHLTATSLLFNGNVQVNGLSTVSGDVHAGGTASIAATVSGSLFANGNVTVNGTAGRVASNGSVTLGTFGEVNGNVSASQNLTLGSSADIHGNALYGDTLSLGTFAKIDGSVTKAPNSTAVDHFATVAITPDTFTSGGANVATQFATTTILAPGKYGTLAIDKGTLQLSPGKYFFDNVTSTGSFMTLNLRLDLPGAIEIYVTGDYNNPLQVTNINGVPLSNADTSLASRVLLESHGNIHLGWDNLGTLYAPSGDITIDSLTNVYGAVYAGHDAIFGGGANVFYIPTGVTGTTVPEPTSLAILGIASLTVLRRRRPPASLETF